MTEEINDKLEKVDAQKIVEKDNPNKKNDAKIPIPAEILNKLPPEAAKEISSFLSMSSMVGRMPNPIMEKVTDQHIDKLLDAAAKNDERSFENQSTSRKYTAFYVIAGISIFVFLTIFFGTSDKAMYKDILEKIIAVGGGFLGGFGVKTYLDKK